MNGEIIELVNVYISCQEFIDGITEILKKIKDINKDELQGIIVSVKTKYFEFINKLFLDLFLILHYKIIIMKDTKVNEIS